MTTTTELEARDRPGSVSVEDPAHPAPRPKRALIGNLQALRAYAASGVVVYHCHAEVARNSIGFYGVAVFFVLSGYLMCRIRDRSAWDFARDRIWRIVPNYWLSMAALLTVFGMWSSWPVEHVVLSALFIPHDSPAGLFPVLGVGWTLNLEMYFYAVFALAILISRRLAPILAGAIILAVLWSLPHLTDNPAALWYYTHDHVPYFLFGIVIWYGSEWVATKNVALPGWLFPASLVAYTATVVFEWLDPWIAVPGVFAVAIVAAHAGADIRSKPLILLGNASYACYLLHTILIEWLRHQGFETSGTVLFTVAVVAASWALALVWHLTLERMIAAGYRAWRARRS